MTVIYVVEQELHGLSSRHGQLARPDGRAERTGLARSDWCSSLNEAMQSIVV